MHNFILFWINTYTTWHNTIQSSRFFLLNTTLLNDIRQNYSIKAHNLRITRTRPNHVLIETDISVRAQPLNLTLIPLYKGWRRIKLKIQYSPSGYNQSHHPASFEMLNREYTFIFFWVKIQLIIALGYEASFPHLIQNIHEHYWVLVRLELW